MADFTRGDYEYTIIDSSNNYVGAQVVDKTKTSYEDIPSTVVNNGTTYSVIYIGSCFYNCTSLIIAPNISDNVQNMNSCFFNCTSLTTVPNIPSGVTNMVNCFKNCSSLKDTIHVYNSPTGYLDIFLNTTKPITIYDHNRTPSTTWQTIANTYNNVSYTHAYAILDTYTDTDGPHLSIGGKYIEDTTGTQLHWPLFIRHNLFVISSALETKITDLDWDDCIE